MGSFRVRQKGHTGLLEMFVYLFFVFCCCCCLLCICYFIVPNQIVPMGNQAWSRSEYRFVCFSSVQFCSVPWPIGSSGGHEGRLSRDPLPVFSAEGPCEQFWHGQICPLFDVVHLAFPLPTTASPTLQGGSKDGFGEAVVAYLSVSPTAKKVCLSNFCLPGSFSLIFRFFSSRLEYRRIHFSCRQVYSPFWLLSSRCIHLHFPYPLYVSGKGSVGEGGRAEWRGSEMGGGDSVACNMQITVKSAVIHFWTGNSCQ